MFQLLRNTVLVLAGLSLAFAQGGPGGAGGSAGSASNPYNGPRPSGRPDLAKAQVIDGTISKINLGFGLRYPTITVNNIVVRVGPAWFFLDNDSELVVGERVRVTAAVSTRAGDPYLHGIQIVRVQANVTLRLRNEEGVPLWLRVGRGTGLTPPARIGACVDTTTIKTVSGNVEDVNLGLGLQHPTLTLQTDTGSVLTFKLGPERVLLASDVEILPGVNLRVKYATSLCSGELIALEIMDADGDVLLLRTDDGLPAW